MLSADTDPSAYSPESICLTEHESPDFDNADAVDSAEPDPEVLDALVLAALAEMREPASTRELLAAIRIHHPGSVYKAVHQAADRLTEAGLTRRFRFGSAWRYELLQPRRARDIESAAISAQVALILNLASQLPDDERQLLQKLLADATTTLDDP